MPRRAFLTLTQTSMTAGECSYILQTLYYMETHRIRSGQEITLYGKAKIKRARQLSSLSMPSTARPTSAIQTMATWNLHRCSNLILMAQAIGLLFLPSKASGCTAASSSSFTKKARQMVHSPLWFHA